jgi:hypothetical protein
MTRVYQYDTRRVSRSLCERETEMGPNALPSLLRWLECTNMIPSGYLCVPLRERESEMGSQCASLFTAMWLECTNMIPAGYLGERERERHWDGVPLWLDSLFFPFAFVVSLVFCFLLSLLSSVGILETIRSTCLCWVSKQSIVERKKAWVCVFMSSWFLCTLSWVLGGCIFCGSAVFVLYWGSCRCGRFGISIVWGGVGWGGLSCNVEPRVCIACEVHFQTLLGRKLLQLLLSWGF